ADPRAGDASLARIGEAYRARIVPDEERRFFGGPPQNPLLVELGERLKNDLGEETEPRIQPPQQLLRIHLAAGDRADWAGLQLPRRREDGRGGGAGLCVRMLGVLPASARGFARSVGGRPRQLNDAVARGGEGRTPPPLPETGPSEIVNLNRGFNQMLSSLR